MKLKHRVMLWYAKRRAKKQTVKSGRQVAAAPKTAGTATTTAVRSGAGSARKATSAAPGHPAGRSRRGK